MTRIEKSIDINASPEKIWQFMSWERTPEWYAAFRKVVHTSEDKDVSAR
jgi:hypothetical protein